MPSLARHLTLLLLGAAASCAPGGLDAGARPLIDGEAEDLYPGVVAVQRLNQEGRPRGLCTGTLIGSRSVVTAKHCVYRSNDEGQSFPVDPSLLRVSITRNTRQGPEVVRYAVSVFTTPGAYQREDLSSGNDIAILTLNEELGVPPYELSRAKPRVGDPITLVGFGRSHPISNEASRSGRKRRGDSMVSGVGTSLFRSSGGAHICKGDSGGPAFDAAGRLLGVISFIDDSDCASEDSFFTSVAPHLTLISSALGLSALPPCTAASEHCDGADNDCDGIVDEGCVPLGGHCREGSDCSSEWCMVPSSSPFDSSSRTPLCVTACDPSGESLGCPEGFLCSATGCGAGVCLAGTPGSGETGEPCQADDDCQDFYCDAPSEMGLHCGRQCSPGALPCPLGLVCSVVPGFDCGSCQLPTPGSPLPFASPCETGAQCLSGLCDPAGYCNQSCHISRDCLGPYHCSGDRCLPGEPLALGMLCGGAEECDDPRYACVDYGGGQRCALDCLEGCPDAMVCLESATGAYCLPNLRALGEVCTDDEACFSGSCGGGQCRLPCGRGECPPMSECRADPRGRRLCLPQAQSRDGALSWRGSAPSCSVGLNALLSPSSPIASLFILGLGVLGLLGLGKRQRRPAEQRPTQHL